MSSPLFDTYQDKATAVRVHYVNKVEPPLDVVDPVEIAKFYSGLAAGNPVPVDAVFKNRLDVVFDVVDLLETVTVDSVEAAEDYIFNMLTPMEIELPGDHPQGCCGAPSLAIQINRQSNLIAQRTRRGVGNLVLTSQKVVDHLVANGHAGYRNTENETSVGRWTLKGTINSSLRVYVSDSIPEDEVYVAYVGSGQAIDGPAGLISTGTGYQLYVMPNSAKALGNAEDYIVRLKITNL